MSKFSRLSINLVIALLFCVLSLIVCEGILRLINPQILDNDWRQFHAKYGWVHKKNETRVIGTYKGEPVNVEFNAQGYRDVYHTVTKPLGSKRVVVIGDSFSAATQVGIDETYWKRFEEMLNTRGMQKGRWEVLNFGIGGYGTVQELLTLVDIGLKYQPDAIILQIFAVNDICDNSMKAAFFINPQDYYRPYMAIDGSDEIVYMHPLAAMLRQKSLLFAYVEPYALKVIYKMMGEPFIGTEEHMLQHGMNILREKDYFGIKDFSQLEAAHILLNAFSQPKDQLTAIQEGWLATEKAIVKIVNVAEQNNIPIILLSIPHDSQLEPRYSEFKEKMPFAFDRKYVDNRLRKMVESRGVPYVYYVDKFSANLDTVLPYIGGHLNPAAHGIVAEGLFKEFEKNYSFELLQ